MTSTDDHDFDRRPLERVDRPRPLPVEVDDRVRRAMLDAFDEAAGTGEVRPARPVSIVPTTLDPLERIDTSRPRSRRLMLLAAAALALLLAGAVFVQRSDSDVAPAAPDDDPNRAAVTAFCNAAFNPAVVGVGDFLDDGRSEPLDRALRGIELGVQAYADLADVTTPDLGATIAPTAADLQARAAEIRRSGAIDDATLGAVAADLAGAVSDLPGSRPCDIDELLSQRRSADRPEGT